MQVGRLDFAEENVLDLTRTERCIGGHIESGAEESGYSL
jgi:hypothetical protein